MDGPLHQNHDNLSESDGTGWNELLAFSLVLTIAVAFFFAPAWTNPSVLSPADSLLVTESFRGENYVPANRLLTDIVTQNEPWEIFASKELRSGRLPLWNPYSGMGAPHLSNAQSALFFPLTWVSLLLEPPWIAAFIAAVKLWFAGIGAFCLSRRLGAKPWGRWTTGLLFPFSGFIVVWLGYALANVAIFLPWLIWASDRVCSACSMKRIALLAGIIACAFFGGHPETWTQCLIATSAFSFWRMLSMPVRHRLRVFGSLCLAAALALMITAVQMIPTVEYLGHSQAWVERNARAHSPWTVRPPDILAMPLLAYPYVYGSYLRGHPHVEKTLGVDNLNETAGGYAGLAALVLALLTIPRTRHDGVVRFWIGLCLACFLIVYQIPLVDNLIRSLPILKVAHNHRFLLVISLSIAILAGRAMDSLDDVLLQARSRFRSCLGLLLICGGSLLLVAAMIVPLAEATLRNKAEAHYQTQAAARGLPVDAFHARADRMVEETLQFFPRYYSAAGIGTLLLGISLFILRFDRIRNQAIRRLQVIQSALLAILVGELFLFGYGYNPIISLVDRYPENPVTTFLRQRDPNARVLPVDEEFPPNTLMAYSLPDARNYDAIETRASLEFLGPLWSDPPSRLTSNAWTPWNRIEQNLDLLNHANIRFIVTSSSPPNEIDGIVEIFRHQEVRIYEVPGHALIWHRLELVSPPGTEPDAIDRNDTSEWSKIQPLELVTAPGLIDFRTNATQPQRIRMSNINYPGWQVTMDGQHIDLEDSPLIQFRIPHGEHHIVARYLPMSFLGGGVLSLVGCSIAICMAFISTDLKQSLGSEV